MRLTYTITNEEAEDIVLTASTDSELIYVESETFSANTSIVVNVQQARELREALDLLLERIDPPKRVTSSLFNPIYPVGTR